MYKDNDITLNSFALMFSYNFEFYMHKKKPHNQTNYEIIK